jgi:lia operon protein LiaG
MRASAIIRIIVWSLVALALTAVLVQGLTGGFSLGGITVFSSFSYDDSEQYLVGSNQIDMREISEIEINWGAGDVQIIPCEGNEVIFREQAGRALLEEDMMRFYLRGGKLTIQFCAPKRGFRIFSSTPSKSLEVQIPYAMAGSLAELEVSSISAPVSIQGASGAEMKVSSVSGAIHVSDLSCRELDLETVSGGIRGENIEATELEMESVSGTIDISGAFQEASGNSVSGNLTIRSNICPRKVDAETVSGGVRLQIPENDGFTARYHTTSGQFYSSFPTVAQKRQAVYKNGGAEFTFDTVSGSMDIEKL